MLFRTSRIIGTFIVVFIVAFFVMNGRFLIAEVRYDTGFTKPFTSTSPSTSESPSPTPPVITSEAILNIPSIGVYSPIIFDVPDNTDSLFANLEKGVVHYTASPRPGQKGTAIILGHSSAYPWYKGNYGSVFALLGKLNPGDKFSVTYSNGKTFDYSVVKGLVFNPITDSDKASELENNSKPSLILMSCWPVGTNYKRLAVLAEQI